MIRWIRPYIFTIATVVFVLDRVSKYVALNSLAVGESIRVIPNIFHFTLVRNNGAAFGLFKSGAAFFIIFSVMAITLIILFIARSQALSLSTATSLALISGGAAGNLVDRLKFGYVIDYLDFRIWPVFNIADTAICVGVGLLAITLFTKRS